MQGEPPGGRSRKAIEHRVRAAIATALAGNKGGVRMSMPDRGMARSGFGDDVPEGRRADRLLLQSERSQKIEDTA
jgi:hypothetical protein